MHLTLTLYVSVIRRYITKNIFLRSIYSSFQDLIYTGPGKSLNGQKLEKIHLSITRAGPAFERQRILQSGTEFAQFRVNELHR